MADANDSTTPPTRWGRRLSDLLAEANFLLVQLQALQETGKPHKTRGLAQRIARMHRRLNDVEGQLRLWAKQLGHDDQATITELRQMLQSVVERDPAYRGPERRQPASKRVPPE